MRLSKDSTLLLHQPCLGRATSAQFRSSSFPNLLIRELIQPLGACSAHSLLLQCQTFVKPLLLQLLLCSTKTLRGLAAIECCRNPDSRIQSSRKKNHCCSLAHVPHLLGEQQHCTRGALLTFLAKGNKLGWVIRSELVPRRY